MRNIPTSFRSSIENPNDPDPVVVFLLIEHDDLDEPQRFNWDSRDYRLDGETWRGFPFEIELLSDSEQSPGGSILIQNIDRRIGDAVRALSSAPTVTVKIYAASSFDITLDPAFPIGTPEVAYEFSNVFLREIEVDAMSVRGSLQSWDYVQEPWPSQRATSDLLPGLYM